MRFTLQTLITILLLGPMLAPISVHASMGNHAPNMRDCLEYCLELMDQQAAEQGVVAKVGDGKTASGVLLFETPLSYEKYFERKAIAHTDISLILKTQKRE